MAVNLEVQCRFHKITNLWLLWSIWVPKLAKGKSKETLKQTLIFVCGKILPLTMSMMSTQPKSLSMRIQLNMQSCQCLRDIIQPSQLMDKLGQVRPTQWRALNITQEIHKGVLSQEVWKRSLDTFRCNQIKIQPSW